MTGPIHLLNPMRAPAGSEWRTVELFRLLAPHAEVQVWCTGVPHPGLAALVPIRRLDPWRLRFPRDGTLVFIGAYHRVGRWVHLSRARRRIVLYNTFHPRLLDRRARRIGSFGRHRVEFAFASRWLQEASGRPGPVQISIVDLRRFAPREGPRPARPFTVGRLSRDLPEKFHPGDPALFGSLAGEGVRVRILGGTSLRALGPVDARVELLPQGAEDAVEFLRGLDCLVYRTGDAWPEAHGRVVQEAMACGVPVVCGHAGGMREYVEHGRSGFVFRDGAEAVALVRRLRDDPALAARVGAAAREAAERIFSPEAMRAVVEFYLRGA